MSTATLSIAPLGYVVVADVLCGAIASADMLLPVPQIIPANNTLLTGPRPGLYARGGPVVAGSYEAYAVNLSNGAVTHYTNYPFNNIVRLGNSFYAVSATGVARIGGLWDVAAEINGQAKLFSTDFKNSNTKRIAAAYLSGRATNGVTVGVTADEGAEYSYDSIFNARAGLGNHRVVPGKGIRGVYYSFDLMNKTGGSFDIDELTIELAPSERAV